MDEHSENHVIDERVDLVFFFAQRYSLTIHDVSRQDAESILDRLENGGSYPVRVGRHLIYPNQLVHVTISPVNGANVNDFTVEPDLRGLVWHDNRTQRTQRRRARRRGNSA